MLGLVPPQAQPPQDLRGADLIGRVSIYAGEVERPDVVLEFWLEIDAADLTDDERD